MTGLGMHDDSDIDRPETPAYTLDESEELGEILSWRRGPAPVVAAPGGRSSIESGLLEIFEARTQEADGIPDLARQMFASLSEASKRRLVHHPYLAGYLRDDFRMSPEQLSYFVASTLARAGRTSALDSPLADATASPQPDGKVASRQFRCVFEDSDHLPLYEGGQRFTHDLGAAGAELALGRTEAALAGIACISPAAAAFVNTYLWALALRAHPDGPDKLGSRSYQCLPGLALFCNPHSGKATRFDLEEALIHETIHSFLFFAEMPSSPLLRDSRFRQEEIRSPWTSSVLGFHTGVHALIVWLALIFYWSAADQYARSPERARHAGERCDFARKGLQAADSAAFLKTVKNGVAPPVMHLMDKLLARAASL